MNPIYLFTSTDGRIPRRNFWIGILIITVAGIPVLLLAAVLAGGTGVAIANLFFLWCGFALSVKRAQDRNRHYLFVAAYFALLVVLTSLQASTAMSISDKMMDPSVAPRALVAAVSVLFLAYVVFLFVELGCLRGTVGPNKYGPDPLAASAPQPEQA